MRINVVFMLLWLVVFSACANATATPPAETKDDPKPETELVAGTWLHRGVKDIIGQGIDTAVTLAQDDNGQWTIAFEYIHFPSVNEDDRTPERSEEGPYTVTAEKGLLSFAGKDRRMVYSYKFDGDRLVMPAIIEFEPGKFIYHDSTHAYRRLHIELANDHREVPMGKASFEGGVIASDVYYSYEEAPRIPQNKGVKYLRLLTRAKGGELVEQGRLIFDRFGSPRYERLLSTGERSGNNYRIRHYHRQDPTEADPDDEEDAVSAER